MTILFLISSEGYYGVENMLVTLAQNLSLLGCKCIIGVFCDSRFPHTEVSDIARSQGLAVEALHCNGKWDVKSVVEIRNLLVRHSVDVLHPHGYKADVYAYVSSWACRVALVATSHNWPSRRLAMRAYAALDRLVLGRFDKVIVVSDVVAKVLRAWGVPPQKLCTVFNGVDVERFHEATPTLRSENLLDGHSLIGLVGRLVEDKGGKVLLRAAQKVLNLHPKTKFVFVGEGTSRKELQTMAADFGITRQVLFAGVRNDMPGVYASLEIVVLPSLIESMPICVLEAMAAARPVIATTVGAVPQLVIPEQTGLLVAPADVDGLAAAIIRLLDNKAFARQLGNNGRTYVRQHFSAEAMARLYLRHYEQVLSGRSKSDVSRESTGRDLKMRFYV